MLPSKQVQLLAEVDRDLGVGIALLDLGVEVLEFEPLDGVFDVADVARGRLEVLGAALTRNFESPDLRLVVVNLRRQDHCHRVVHQERLREARSEAGAIHIDLPGLGEVDFFAARAEILKATGFEGVTEAHWENFLPIAEGARARPVDSIQKLLVYFRQAARCQHEPGMD